MKKNKKLSAEEELMLAEKIKLLWRFILFFKPYRDILEKIAKEAEKKSELAVSTAVFNPTGWEVAEKKHKRIAKRARLLVEMIDCLEETDREVLQALEKEKQMKKIRKLFE